MTIDVLSPEFDRRMAAQNKEFDACAELAKQYERLTLTPPVDDDYSEIRHCYESALRSFIDAMQDNGRFPSDLKKSVAVKSVANDSMQRIAEINMARCSRWHSPGSRQWSLSEWVTATTGELGEACDVLSELSNLLMDALQLTGKLGQAANVIKKLNRARDRVIGNKESVRELHIALEKEIADTFLYLDLLASHAGIDLFTAVRAKFNETSEKHGFPERL